MKDEKEKDETEKLSLSLYISETDAKLGFVHQGCALPFVLIKGRCVKKGKAHSLPTTVQQTRAKTRAS